MTSLAEARSKASLLLLEISGTLTEMARFAIWKGTESPEFSQFAYKSAELRVDAVHDIGDYARLLVNCDAELLLSAFLQKSAHIIK
ncbi:MAG: hypothetical protein RL368_1436, partial [Pseudomonadota bacterium]